MGKEWLESFKIKALDLSKKTGKNVNYVVNIKKTEMEILNVNREISKIYKVIGELIYTSRKENGDESNVDILCKQIDVKKSYIGELEKRIELIKEKKKLEEYDLKYDEADIPDFIKNTETDEEIEVLQFCPECNTGNKVGEKVCKECGKKLSTKTKKSR